MSLGFDGRFFEEQWFRGDEANEVEPLDGYFTASARAAYQFGPWKIEGILYNLFDAADPLFGTFNFNQRTEELERFLTPLNARSVRVTLRRSFGDD